MSASPENTYYDRGFCPDLVDEELIKQNHLKWITRWGMTEPGVPVAMANTHKAAVWRGDFNSYHEAPALAVVLPRLAKSLSPALPVWYAGALTMEMMQRAQSEELAVFEAAEHGPYSLTVAVELLAQFIPPETYPPVP